ncbi:hypothetical protein EVAR_45536_1 [Eumeta japonica]|uniref:Uncharacterized protein n=1 Tax=Eumeta variegata TaxID=151549 RepID=A0A4C1X6C1_EUMVA|nr:hypothetical protein EVAR_45536_1 [Eumeta japonica]
MIIAPRRDIGEAGGRHGGARRGARGGARADPDIWCALRLHDRRLPSAHEIEWFCRTRLNTNKYENHTTSQFNSIRYSMTITIHAKEGVTRAGGAMACARGRLAGVACARGSAARARARRPSLVRSNVPVKGGDAANLCKSRAASASRPAAAAPRLHAPAPQPRRLLAFVARTLAS